LGHKLIKKHIKKTGVHPMLSNLLGKKLIKKTGVHPMLSNLLD
jgi:hypothetical protein